MTSLCLGSVLFGYGFRATVSVAEAEKLKSIICNPLMTSEDYNQAKKVIPFVESISTVEEEDNRLMMVSFNGGSWEDKQSYVDYLNKKLA